MTLREFINCATDTLGVLYPKPECKSIAVRLLVEIGGYSNYAHMVEPDAVIEGSVERQLVSGINRMSVGEPLQYVLGYEWFCGAKFNVAPGVLIPRPETEELVMLIAQQYKGCNKVKVLDICSGSGCIAYSLGTQFNGRADVYGCDISAEALSIARNQKILAGDNEVKVGFFECDILSPNALENVLGNVGDGFDIIVSNPPYICEQEKGLMRTNVLDFEPHLALFVPDNNPLLFYIKIATLSKDLLKSSGRLFFEINERFGSQTIQMLEQLGYTNCQVVKDLNGKDRMTVAMLP